MKKHAMLSPSGASRWLTCTPSARLEQQMLEQQSSYADEGTFAHELSELLIKEKGYGVDLTAHIERLINSREGELYYNEEMHTYCSEYAEFVVNYVREAPPGSILIQEAQLDLNHYIPESFGHVDNSIIGEEWLTVIDFKFGKGVPVSAENNKQMMVYALGAYRFYNILYDMTKVRMIIYQPRIDNISIWEITVEDLVKWANETLRPTAMMAWKGEGELVAGDHCRFCRVRARCSELARHNLELTHREFDPALLEDEQVSKILLKSKQIKSWITAVEKYALQKAIEGKQWPGMKVVLGRSVRKYADEEKIKEELAKDGADVNKLLTSKLLGIIKLSKQLTKLQFEKCVEPHLIKPPGKPAIVSIEDKRPEWDRKAEIDTDFEIIEEE